MVLEPSALRGVLNRLTYLKRKKQSKKERRGRERDREREGLQKTEEKNSNSRCYCCCPLSVFFGHVSMSRCCFHPSSDLCTSVWQSAHLAMPAGGGMHDLSLTCVSNSPERIACKQVGHSRYAPVTSHSCNKCSCNVGISIT